MYNEDVPSSSRTHRRRSTSSSLGSSSASVGSSWLSNGRSSVNEGSWSEVVLDGREERFGVLSEEERRVSSASEGRGRGGERVAKLRDVLSVSSASFPRVKAVLRLLQRRSLRWQHQQTQPSLLLRKLPGRTLTLLLRREEDQQCRRVQSSRRRRGRRDSLETACITGGRISVAKERRRRRVVTYEIDLPLERVRIEGVVSRRDVGVGDGKTVRR